MGRLLRERIAAHGPLDFAAFMATALYHPDLGYYAREARQVGRGGDFFTSVSVGPLFGDLLARRFLRWWLHAGHPQSWRLIECGAHDGTLAADVLAALRSLAPAAFAGLQYAIPEPLPRLQAAQRKTLRPFAERVHFLTNPAELAARPLPGIAFGNEVLDALPFQVIEWQADGWHLCQVGQCGSPGTGDGENRIRAGCPDHGGAGILPAAMLHSPPGADKTNGIDQARGSTDGRFCWTTPLPLSDPAQLAALAPLGGDFPIGYRSELRTNYGGFFAPLLAGLSSGLLLWFDYGFARPEYYHPARHQGTLRTFSRHRAADNPLLTPGEIDITAHVDFTAVAEVAISLDCHPLLFRNQGSWLTEVAREWLLAMEGQPDAALLRQFHSLTHPAQLGGRFHVLELAWNDPAPAAISAADLHRLALGGVSREKPWMHQEGHGRPARD